MYESTNKTSGTHVDIYILINTLIMNAHVPAIGKLKFSNFDYVNGNNSHNCAA